MKEGWGGKKGEKKGRRAAQVPIKNSLGNQKKKNVQRKFIEL